MRNQGKKGNGSEINKGNVEEDINMVGRVVSNFGSIRERCTLASYFDAQYGNCSGGLVIIVSDPATTGFTAMVLNSFAV